MNKHQIFCETLFSISQLYFKISNLTDNKSVELEVCIKNLKNISFLALLNIRNGQRPLLSDIALIKDELYKLTNDSVANYLLIDAVMHFDSKDIDFSQDLTSNKNSLYQLLVDAEMELNKIDKDSEKLSKKYQIIYSLAELENEDVILKYLKEFNFV